MRLLLLIAAALCAAPVLGQNFDDAVLATPLPRGEGLSVAMPAASWPRCCNMVSASYRAGPTGLLPTMPTIPHIPGVP